MASGESELVTEINRVTYLTQLALMTPGFGFRPTDVELVTYHLRTKVRCREPKREFNIIGEIDDLYKHEPWDLPDKSVWKGNDAEWYFFCPLDKNCGRTNRSTEAGYWKRTGRDKEVQKNDKIVGMRKTLTFYKGRAPRGEKTQWSMYEYRLDEAECERVQFVLCRVSKKNGDGPQTYVDEDAFIQLPSFEGSKLVKEGDSNSPSGMMWNRDLGGTTPQVQPQDECERDPFVQLPSLEGSKLVKEGDSNSPSGMMWNRDLGGGTTPQVQPQDECERDPFIQLSSLEGSKLVKEGDNNSPSGMMWHRDLGGTTPQVQPQDECISQDEYADLLQTLLESLDSLPPLEEGEELNGSKDPDFGEGVDLNTRGRIPDSPYGYEATFEINQDDMTPSWLQGPPTQEPIKKNGDPRWGQRCQWILDVPPTSDPLHAEVRRKSMGLNPLHLKVDINLGDVVNNKCMKERYQLIDLKNGRIQVELQWKTG